MKSYQLAFHIYYNDRGSMGGGVMFAFKKPIFCIPVPSLNHLELLTITLHLKIPSPYVQFMSFQTEIKPIRIPRSIISIKSDKHDKFCGHCWQFNTPDINWMSLTGSIHSSKSLCDFLFEHINLNQLVNYPTHTKVKYRHYSNRTVDPI